MMRASEYLSKVSKPVVSSTPVEEIDWVRPGRSGYHTSKSNYDVVISKSVYKKDPKRARYTITFYSGVHELITDSDTCAVGFVGDRIYFCKPGEGISGYTLSKHSRKGKICETRTTMITDTRCENFIDSKSGKGYYELCYDNVRNLCYIEVSGEK